MGDYAIRLWFCSYYINSMKKWVYGHLIVNSTGVKFVFKETKTSADIVGLRLNYESITEVKKSTSSFIYSALVITSSENNESHWFCSLPNRDSAFTIIHHFWRGALLPKDTSNLKKTGGTAMGKNLLQLTEDSEKTLQSSAAQLHHQGIQLDFSAALMSDLHNDLDVSKKLLQHMDSWFGTWHIKGVKDSTVDPMEMVSKDGIPEIFEFQILFHKPATSGKGQAQCCPQPGVLQASLEGLNVLDEKLKSHFFFSHKEVSAIMVKTPWELMICHHKIGEPDRVCVLMSANLIPTIQRLSIMFQQKIQYEEAPMELAQGIADVRIEGGSPYANTETPGGSSCQQSMQQEQIVSDTEAQELSAAVNRMKHLALGIQQEEDRQARTIDKLTDTVEHANDRLKYNTKKINRML